MDDPELVALRRKLAERERATELPEMRADFDRFSDLYPLQPDVVVEAVDVRGVEGEWTRTPQAQSERVILYLHGGGYVIGSLRSHRHLVAEIGRAARARTLALHYRLAPEHPFPAAVDDALEGYRYLMRHAISPERIAIAGDSAGGGLAIALMLAIRKAALPQPACAWLISPWTDMEGSGASIAGNAERDPTVKKDLLLQLAGLYLNGADARSPLASPIHADLRGIAPLLIQVGSVETLLDDSVRLARAAGLADVPVDLQIWPGVPHVWHLFHPELKAGMRAIRVGGDYILSKTQ